MLLDSPAADLRFSSGDLSVLYLEPVKRVRTRVVCMCACGRQIRVSLDRWEKNPPKACRACIKARS